LFGNAPLCGARLAELRLYKDDAKTRARVVSGLGKPTSSLAFAQSDHRHFQCTSIVLAASDRETPKADQRMTATAKAPHEKRSYDVFEEVYVVISSSIPKIVLKNNNI
jgi:hypothetical protein